MLLTLNPSDFWQFRLFIGLIIDNLKNIVNNLDRFVFLEYPNRYPDWVAHLSTQRFWLTPCIVLYVLLYVLYYIEIQFSLFLFSFFLADDVTAIGASYNNEMASTFFIPPPPDSII